MTALYMSDGLNKHDEHWSPMTGRRLSSITHIYLLAVYLVADRLPHFFYLSEHHLTEAMASKSIVSVGVSPLYDSI